jgi:AcrR family transcriptional regulator
MAEEAPSLRERRAQLTRDEILGAARRLFAERGYARTSVRDIAKAAGVSAQTVYDSVGSKQALVSSLNDLIDAEAGIAAIARAAAESADPGEVAATNARITRSILEHCGDIIHALVTGAAAEP